jgi:RNA polymerase subunit RPABC4/transcription elongation factor Spt4
LGGIGAQIQPEPNADRFPLSDEGSVVSRVVRKEPSERSYQGQEVHPQKTSKEAAPDPEKKTSGLIRSFGADRYWFNGGVIIAGLGIAAILAVEGFTLGKALIAGIASAAAFIFCFDREGNWNFIRAIPAIGAVVLIAYVLKVPVIGGVAGFLLYYVVGSVAAFIGSIPTRMKKLHQEALSTSKRYACLECGSKVSETDTICPHCGAKFDEFTCSECGSNIPGDATICPECGGIFDESE